MTSSPKRAFAIVAHPDDIEFVMAGTLLRLQAAGYEIHYMTLANGSCGTVEHSAQEIVQLRAAEARAAAESVEAVFHPSLVNDLEIFYNHATLARLASVMREVAPEILLVHSPSDYMEDHMNAARLAVTAAFARNMRNYPADPPRPPVEGWVTIYHAQPYGNRDPLGKLVRPGIYVDVADLVEKKAAMLACHRSQNQWIDSSQGIDSLTENMKKLSREVGRLSGHFEYAEGWRKHSPLGFCPEDSDPLVAALGRHAWVDPAYVAGLG